jgi:hypothetical protein
VLGGGVAIAVVAIAVIGVANAPRHANPAAPATPPPAPDIRVMETKWEDCSTMFDVCSRLRCDVGNYGNAAGAADVVFTLLRNGNRTTTEQYVFLGPGESGVKTKDFNEIRFNDKDYRGQCEIRAR